MSVGSAATPHDAFPGDTAAFAGGEESARTALLALSAAESVTDALAAELLRVAGLERDLPELIVAAVHRCDFVIQRSQEWCIASRVREALLRALSGEPGLSFLLHNRILSITKHVHDGELELPLPRYLTEGAGWAYHSAFILPEQQRSECLRQYSEIAEGPRGGQQWLAGRLADQQVRLGVLPAETIEISLLRGMILYKERRTDDAIEILRRVAESSTPSREVAIAAHLVGRHDRSRDRRHAESLLRKSLDLGRKYMTPFHEAQVLHTLGRLIGEQQGRGEEAEELLRSSLEVGNQYLGERHESQVLHTLGRLIGEQQGRGEEAEKLLRSSLKIEERRSDRFSEAQVLHTLGKLIGTQKGRGPEAREMMERSLEIGRQLGRTSHQARVLYSLATLPEVAPEDARALLEESLRLARLAKDRPREKIVFSALEKLPKQQQD